MIKTDFDPPIVFYAPVSRIKEDGVRIQRYERWTRKGVRNFLRGVQNSARPWYEVDEKSRLQFDAFLTLEALDDGE